MTLVAVASGYDELVEKQYSWDTEREPHDWCSDLPDLVYVWREVTLAWNAVRTQYNSRVGLLAKSAAAPVCGRAKSRSAIWKLGVQLLPIASRLRGCEDMPMTT